MVSKEEAFENLKNNTRVTRLDRFVLRKDDDPDRRNLSIDKLASLGKEGQLYAFVTDYDEVKGKPAIEAARMAGLDIKGAESISAIIFPLNGHDLFPASARGLLQVISQAETVPLLIQNLT